MRQTKKIVTVSTRTASVICNMCGEEIPQHKHCDNYLSVDKTWGYGTGYDGQRHSFELCEKCYEKLLSQFKIGI